MSHRGHKVAIIGAGNVGSILGGALLRGGKHFQVKYGVREPSATKYKKLLSHQTSATLASVHEAVAWADVVLLALPGAYEDSEIRSAAESLGTGVEGKIVIDATNPLGSYPGLEMRIWEHGTSAGEVLAFSLPKSYVYKAFNTIGAEHMDAADGSKIPGYDTSSGPLTMLIAGAEDMPQRAVVEDVVAGVGFAPRYVGPIRYARNLEALAELWIHLGVESAGETKEVWGRNFHFQVVGK